MNKGESFYYMGVLVCRINSMSSWLCVLMTLRAVDPEHILILGA